MAKYERSLLIQAPARTVYEFVADVNNMPKYLPTTQHASMHDGDRVRVEGQNDGQSYVDEGYLHVEEEFKRLAWGADEQDYSGWLDVENASDTETKVTVGLSFRDNQDDEVGQQRIEQSLEQALESIRQHVTS